MNKETVTINRNDLTDAFMRTTKRESVKKIISTMPTLIMFVMMINFELEKELFGDNEKEESEKQI